MERIYLITGAGGYLGGTVVRALSEAGARVRALVMTGDEAAKARLPRGTEIYEGDVCERQSCEAFFQTSGEEVYVVHAAGIVTIASKYDEKVRAVNVGGTENIISLCEEHKVKKLVHVSTVHAIPELAHGQVMREVNHFDPDLVKGLYAKTKAEATEYALAAARRGLDVSVVHPSGISGPGDPGRGYLKQLMLDFCSGGLSAGVEGGYDFVDVRDVAAGIISCLERGRAGECYILSNRYVSVRELLDMMSEVTGKRKIKTILPLWLAKLTAPLAEVYYKILKQPPLYTAYSMYTLSSNALFSHEKASRELGYTARPFIETLEDTYKWLEAEGMLKRAKQKKPKKARANKLREGA